MGHNIILVIHVFLAFGIVGLVLLQKGKGADAGAGFGSGASGTVFGARGSATVFSKATAILATLFFVTSLTLAYLSGQRPAPKPAALIEQPAPAETVPAPAAPAAPQGSTGSAAGGAAKTPETPAPTPAPAPQ